MIQIQDMSLSAFDQYRREVSWIPQLSGEEEACLLQCIEQRKIECSQQCSRCDICGKAQQARTRLVEGYQHLVSRLAWRYASRNQELYLDLVQEGNLGLLQALEQYDGRVGIASFETWVFAWVKGAICRALSVAGVIRLPRRKVEAILQLEKVCDDLMSVLGREFTMEEIAQEMRLTTHEVCELFVLSEQRAVMSLEEPVDEDEEETVGGMLEDTSFAGKHGDLADALQNLTDEELTVILLRYGLGKHQAHSQREAAQVLGMGLSNVQLLDQRARLRLRRVLEEQAS